MLLVILLVKCLKSQHGGSMAGNFSIITRDKQRLGATERVAPRDTMAKCFKVRRHHNTNGGPAGHNNNKLASRE